MKRSFAVGGATFAIMFAIALSFGANSAEAQLLCRVKARCTPVVQKCCAPKLRVRTSCCKAETTCCEPAKVETCCKPAPKCCAPAPTCCETSCCKPRVRLLTKLRCRPKCCPKSTCSSCSTGCSDCEAKPATEDEKKIPPAPEATKEAKKTT